MKHQYLHIVSRYGSNLFLNIGDTVYGMRPLLLDPLMDGKWNTVFPDKILWWSAPKRMKRIIMQGQWEIA